MSHTIHANARTTPRIRAEIRASRLGIRELARKYNTSPETIRKWRSRDDFEDRSHRPHRLQTTLNEVQEYIVCELRRTLLLPLDDLLVITREFINGKASRSAIARLLRRNGLNNLCELRPQTEDEKKPVGKFADYEPGFVHVDVKYLPQMPNQSSRSYLFVAVDRATRWVYLEIRRNRSARSAEAFLKGLTKAAPFKIHKVLTDNGKEFTDRFRSGGRGKPSGRHDFDRLCRANGIEHRLTKPYSPQTNGMVERFNGRIAELLKTTRFSSIEELAEMIRRYEKAVQSQHPAKGPRPSQPCRGAEGMAQKETVIIHQKRLQTPGT